MGHLIFNTRQEAEAAEMQARQILFSKYQNRLNEEGILPVNINGQITQGAITDKWSDVIELQDGRFAIAWMEELQMGEPQEIPPQNFDIF